MSPNQEHAVRTALPGAQDHGQGIVTFGLHAPGKKRVELLGDFNDFAPGRDVLTERQPGFWVGATTLERGRHSYQFLIDGEILIADPYAQEIAPGDEQPPKAVIDAGRPIYQWQHADWQRPALEDLVIYELHVGDFSPAGTFQGVLEQLDYLRDLGVNAVEFMPLGECAPNDYRGYEPTYFLAPRREYGSFEDLVVLVDECHARGIGVILDLVLAHTARQHPFASMYDYEQSPWYGKGLGEENQFGLPMLDFTRDATNGFVRDVQAYWLKVLRVDGFRYDYLAAIGEGEQGQRGLPYLMRTAREIRPHAYLIGECIPEDPEMVNPSGIGAVWHTRSRLALTTLLIGRDCEPYKAADFAETVTAFDPATQDYDRPSLMVNYLECHDDPRLVKMASGAGDDDATALRKAALAVTILMTAPGEPMLYAGQEIGVAADTTIEVNKLDWSLGGEPERTGLLEHLRWAIRLRRSHDALRRGSFEMPLVDADKRCIVYHRTSGEADRVVVAANFSPQPRALDVPMPNSGQWHRYGQPPFTVGDSKLCPLRLEPWTADVLLAGVS
jgi:1,4-alpha-glucan branching enzyme